MIRFGLMLAILVVAVALVATHGIRGVALLIVLALVATLPQTRGWRTGERWLVRIFGSRRRAAAMIFGVTISVAVAVNVYELIR